MNLNLEAAGMLAALRRQRPLVHNITNLVVTNISANAALAIGASPVMAHAHEEVAELTGLAQALVLNIGTLTPYLVQSMLLAGRAANARSIPVVLDPVGYGVTALRTRATRELIAGIKVSVLRGNVAEVAGIAGIEADIKGVDALGAAAPGAALAREAARSLGLVTAVTGATDYVSDGRRLARVENGDPWLTLVTGTGCMATVLVAAFAAVEHDYLKAAAGALACYGVAAELARERACGPGTFASALFDQLHALTPELVAERARVTVEG